MALDRGHLAEVLGGILGVNQFGRARIPMECTVVRAKLWANGRPQGTCALSSRRLAGSPLSARYRPSAFDKARSEHLRIQYQNQNTDSGGLRRADGLGTTRSLRHRRYSNEWINTPQRQKYRGIQKSRRQISFRPYWNP